MKETEDEQIVIFFLITILKLNLKNYVYKQKFCESKYWKIFHS